MKTFANPQPVTAAPAVATAAPRREQPRHEHDVPDLSHLAQTRSVRDMGAPSDPRDAEKTLFLRGLRDAITDAVTGELAGTGWSAEQCPYLEYWFAYYDTRSHEDVERALRRYAPASGDATSLDAYVTPTVARVRAAVARWKATGEIDAPIDVTEEQAQLVELGPGEPLDSATRTRFESALETDLSQTRIHRDARSAAASAKVAAHAFSIGDHVAFDANEYAPGTLRGDALLAHELVHTEQQRRGATTEARDNHALEHNADAVATSVLARLWGGAKTGVQSIASTRLQLQRCKAPAKAPADLPKLTIEQKAAWITKAMDDDLSGADLEIVKVFQTVKTPIEFKQLQKLVDMKRVLKFENNFGAAMLAAIGPLLEGDEIVMDKWLSLIVEESDYFVSTTEPFVHYFFLRMATNQLRTVLSKLAERGKLAKTIGRMPSVLMLIKQRGIDLGKFVDKTGSGPRKFARGVWSSIKSATTSQTASDNEKTSKYMRQQRWGALLPPVYEKWRQDAVNQAFKEAEAELSKPSNIIIGEIDYITFGIPLGAYHLVVGTGKGIYHLGTGDYEEAGAELTGALILLATYASVKVFRVVRARPSAAAATGVAGVEIEVAASADEVTLSAEGEAVTKRLYDKLGAERAIRVARYIQEDSAAARFALENEEAGIYALDEANGNVAAAEKALPEIQRRLAAEQAAAVAEAKAPPPESPPAQTPTKPVTKPPETPPADPTKAQQQKPPPPPTEAQQKPPLDPTEAQQQKPPPPPTEAPTEAQPQKPPPPPTEAPTEAQPQKPPPPAPTEAQQTPLDPTEAQQQKPPPPPIAAQQKPPPDPTEAQQQKPPPPAPTETQQQKPPPAEPTKAQQQKPPDPTDAEHQKAPPPKVTPPPAKPHVSGKTKAEFVAEYKRLNPRTRFSQAELEALYDENRYVINPQTGLLNDVNAGKFGPPQHRADYVRDAANQPVTETIPRDKVPADLEARAQALAERRRQSLKAAKDARTRAGAAVENETQAAKDARVAAETEAENEAMQQGRLASKELGEDAAEQFGKRFEGDGVTKTKGAGAGDFDFTYTGAASEEATVLEAKGGESGLGTRYGVDGVTRVEQGTGEYAKAVIEDIKKRDPVRAAQLTKALEAGKLKYYVVRQTVTAAGELGPIEILEFKP